MRKFLALVFCVGCSNGSERNFEGVQALDRATVENHIYYIDLSVADTPLTADEVQDGEGAIPVRLLAGERFVAAIALDPSMGSKVTDRLMGVWKINRDLVPNGEAESTGTDPGSLPGTREPPVIKIERPTASPSDESTFSADAELVVDWDDSAVDIKPYELDILIDFHPGCI